MSYSGMVSGNMEGLGLSALVTSVALNDYFFLVDGTRNRFEDGYEVVEVQLVRNIVEAAGGGEGDYDDEGR